MKLDSVVGWPPMARFQTTNREKSVEEVFNRTAVLHGVDELKRTISALPAGAQLFWIDRIPSGKGPRTKGSEGIAYPPALIRERVRRYAKKHHIEVEISNQFSNP